jgi:hypothetical protein
VSQGVGPEFQSQIAKKKFCINHSIEFVVTNYSDVSEKRTFIYLNCKSNCNRQHSPVDKNWDEKANYTDQVERSHTEFVIA